MSASTSPALPLGVFAAAVVVMLGAALVATRVGVRRDDSNGSPSAPVMGAIDRDAFPTLPSLVVVRNGKPLELAGPRARPTLLHLWATWCGPCRDELPAILAYGTSGEVEVVALSVDDEWPAVERYFGGTIPASVAWDPQVVVEPALGVRSLPTTFLIDTDGRVRQSWVGAQNWADPALRRSVAGAGH